MGSLTRDEARLRAGLVAVCGYTVDLDLDRGPEVFGSRSEVRFSCRRPGASTFAEVRPRELRSATLNGVPLDVGSLADGRLPLPGLLAENVLVVEADMAYTRDGQGLHRSVDPQDGEAYVYGHLFLDAAAQVFACFDQPDLKASYDVAVTAPQAWTVLGNGAATRVAPGRWALARTQPLATYFVTVCAGPFASVRAEHDGIPLGIHARASLAEALHKHADQMLEVTRRSLDFCHETFGSRYAFGEYHQVFVPEFNAGAMENPGCVTFADMLLFRGQASREQLLTRSNTIAHELAHMWFGNLVTMRWWDDLWLNESFAEYFAHWTLEATGLFEESWTDFLVARKVWGYAAERTPSTHPVAGSPALDADAALHDFDGISYAKGASVLRQLVAYVGEDAFGEGIRAHLSAHALGNAELADFLGAMERASGKDLSAWSSAWLRTAGLDVLSVEAPGDDPTYDGVVLRRATPKQRPADRPHALDLAGFSGGAEQFRVPLAATSPETPVPALAGLPRARLVVPNASDLTWATVRLDDESLRVLPEELPLVADERARGVVWVALVDGVALGWVDPRLVLDVFCAAWPLERSPSVLSRIANGMTKRLVPSYLAVEEKPAALRRLAAAAARVTVDPGADPTLRLTAARLVARWSDDLDRLADWSDGRGLPDGVAMDEELRWEIVRNRAARGVADEDEIAAVLARDPSMTGTLRALSARAARPDPAAKAWAWDYLVAPAGRSNHERLAVAQGFWDPLRPALVEPYVARYFTDVPRLAGVVGEDALSSVAAAAYPSYQVDERTLALTDEALARDGLSAATRRSIVDQSSELAEALRSLRRYGRAAPPD